VRPNQPPRPLEHELTNSSIFSGPFLEFNENSFLPIYLGGNTEIENTRDDSPRTSHLYPVTENKIRNKSTFRKSLWRRKWTDVQLIARKMLLEARVKRIMRRVRNKVFPQSGEEPNPVPKKEPPQETFNEELPTGPMKGEKRVKSKRSVKKLKQRARNKKHSDEIMPDQPSEDAEYPNLLRRIDEVDEDDDIVYETGDYIITDEKLEREQRFKAKEGKTMKEAIERLRDPRKQAKHYEGVCENSIFSNREEPGAQVIYITTIKSTTTFRW
jgi:type IV secretory pathway VirB10-like protein